MAQFETVRPIPSQPFTICSPNYHGQSFSGESVIGIYVAPSAPPVSVGSSPLACTHDVYTGRAASN